MSISASERETSKPIENTELIKDSKMISSLETLKQKNRPVIAQFNVNSLRKEIILVIYPLSLLNIWILCLYRKNVRLYFSNSSI